MGIKLCPQSYSSYTHTHKEKCLNGKSLTKQCMNVRMKRQCLPGAVSACLGSRNGKNPALCKPPNIDHVSRDGGDKARRGGRERTWGKKGRGEK